jgi:hypothetical protein
VAVPRLKPAVGQVLGVAKTPTKKGTTVTNKYQKYMPKTSTGPGLAIPDALTIAMGEIADDMRDGLLALAVGAGLQGMVRGGEGGEVLEQHQVGQFGLGVGEIGAVAPLPLQIGEADPPVARRATARGDHL